MMALKSTLWSSNHLLAYLFVCPGTSDGSISQAYTGSFDVAILLRYYAALRERFIRAGDNVDGSELLRKP